MSKKTVAVIGLGRFGASVATHMYNMGHEVLGIDGNESLVDLYSDKLTHTVTADVTDEDALRALGLRNFDAVVVAIGRDVQASILATVVLKEIGVPYVVVKAATELHGRTLQKVGADKVVYPERDMGARVAHSLLTGTLTDFIELGPEFTILEIAVPPVFAGKTLRELNLRARFGLNVMALKSGDRINAAPLATDTVLAGDILVLLGSNESVRTLERKLRES